MQQSRPSAQNREHILLHLCCAPCGSASLERLLLEEQEVTLFFSNSNIYPAEEFDKRYYYAEQLACEYNLKIIKDPRNHDLWLKHVEGYENEPEGGNRCFRCFQFSLMRSMETAELNRIKNFTTSLTISPHKNSSQIFEAAEGLSSFEKYDFKKKNGFSRSIELSDKFKLYRQNYCGCEFSLRG